jgi:hypothetical protein
MALADGAGLQTFQNGMDLTPMCGSALNQTPLRDRAWPNEPKSSFSTLERSRPASAGISP